MEKIEYLVSYTTVNDHPDDALKEAILEANRLGVRGKSIPDARHIKIEKIFGEGINFVFLFPKL